MAPTASEKTGSKRPAENNDGEKMSKKARKGFTVGPSHLPDGTWKRKNQQIKRSLIDKAKLKQDYAKLQAREEQDRAEAEARAAEEGLVLPAPTAAPHPDRQNLIDREAEDPELNEKRDPSYRGDRRRQRRPKTAPFEREQAAAEKAKAEAEARRKAHEEAEAQRAARLEERERFRKAMAKARTGGKNGQRKLGRESNVLLEKVRRMVAQ
ncbi:hypothetical protein K461DRAFT_294694 [Myriangium duriaei CBS 260.36]|uniref:rRNA-processing protein FYV7 n=1 Tax=Myriangium duriaei CBS 260.36 TaxID=1168546 RepID=A0A9P4MG61_9PEZI|nr:hypothetical protein K461DRAFT_294694 [Myriangium duriaei CBS 260.36]